MKSVKGLSMNKVLGGLKRRATSSNSASNAASSSAMTPAETPEVTVKNSVTAFCQSGGNHKGDEVLFLPPIVEAAESSPTAAAECARIIRKFLSKEYMSRAAWQYNAVMLLRILSDNPGLTFTRNIDGSFVETTKALLKNGRDASVRQILMETLDDFERNKPYDDNLAPIVEMWKAEKAKALKKYGGHMPNIPPRPIFSALPFQTPSQNGVSTSRSRNRLPDAVELSSRLEEARTSAKLLEQVVMNTPPGEMMDNELIKEFSERCQTASRSIQGYMTSEDPAPDNDTMESLIDTNEQLQTALNQHKRAVLNAKKQLGLNERSEEGSPSPSAGAVNGASSSGAATPAAAGGSGLSNGKGKQTDNYEPPPGPPPGVTASGSGSAAGGETHRDAENPFEDPFKDPVQDSVEEEERYPHEPFHPGFGKASLYTGLTLTTSSEKEAIAGNGSSAENDLYEPMSKNKEKEKGPVHSS